MIAQILKSLFTVSLVSSVIGYIGFKTTSASFVKVFLISTTIQFIFFYFYNNIFFLKKQPFYYKPFTKYPPSTYISCPVIYDDASDNKNIIVPTKSLGSPHLHNIVFSSIFFLLLAQPFLVILVRI